MDLIERYLQAVQFWLPKAQKHDIIAELSEDLHAQIEEREASLARPLTDLEIEEILKQRGRPVLVANRFLPQQSLIGPILFPIYLFVVKAVVLGYMVPWILVWIGMMIYSPTYRAHLSHSWIGAVGSVWGAWWGAAFFAIGTVTIVFAVLERVEAKSHFLEKWDPRELPAVRNPAKITRPTASFELLFNAICVVVWASNMYTPVTMISEIQFSVSPLWHWFFWLFLFVSIVNTALAAVNLARPYWTTQRAIVRLLSDAAGSALFCWLLKANLLTGLVIPNVSPEQSAALTNAINFWVAKAFPVSVAVCLIIAGANLYRIIRLNTSRPVPPMGTAYSVPRS